MQFRQIESFDPLSNPACRLFARGGTGERDQAAKGLERNEAAACRSNRFLEDLHGPYDNTIRIMDGARADMDRNPVPIAMAKEDSAFPWLAVVHNRG
jgi:hypothetical protein